MKRNSLEAQPMLKSDIVAMDVHRILAATQSGKITHNAKLNHNGQLQQFLRSIPQSTVVFEMPDTWWLIDPLEELGHDIKALHPQGVRLIAQSCKKTGKNDVETLAHIARLGPYPCV